MAPKVLYENYNMGPFQHQRRSPKPTCDSAGFTMVETVIAIAVLGIGIATTIGALTKVNSIAAMSRNSTGAYTILTNQVDLFQSMSPFNPQKATPEIPRDTSHGGFPTYDMRATVGTQNISVNGTDFKVPVYEYRDANNNVVLVVNGTLTTTVTDLSASLPNTYQAVFTITFTYLNRNYTYSISAIRTSDI
jgi:prepilin-type N-terminal cleavage/methylation domain-containing protein